MRLGLVIGLIIALGSCGGGEDSSCRSSDECRGTLECAGPNDPQVCGVPANERCSSDADCDASERCHAVADPCSPDGVGSECRPPCMDGGCGEGFACGASGACEAIACDAGWDCAPQQDCDPSLAQTGPVHARAHGCVAISCSSDDACPSAGACVNGVCQEDLGSCIEPTPVP